MPNLRQRFFASVVWLPTLCWNYFLARVLRVRNWWDRIDEHLIVGAYPFARDVPELFQLGVRAVVNTCEEYAGPDQQYREAGIEHLRIPTTDFTHPQLADVIQAVEFIEGHAAQGHTVYVHCKAGRARSATVALCWLVKYRNLSPQAAQELLLKKRSHVNPHLTQRSVVQQFIAQLENRS